MFGGRSSCQSKRGSITTHFGIARASSSSSALEVVVLAARSARTGSTLPVLERDRALDRLRVRVEQQLGRVEAVARTAGRTGRGRGSRSAGRRADARQVAVPVERRCARSARRTSRRRRRRTGTARRARRARRRSRSSCRSPSQVAPSGNGAPGQTSISAPALPASGGRTTKPGSSVGSCVASTTSSARSRGTCTGARAKLASSVYSPRRTASQPARSSKSIASTSPGGSSRRSAQQLARAARAGPPARPRASAWSAAKVAGSCGSGTSAPRNSAKAANSRRRPSRVASAISWSMWSEKNWNGARSPYSSPWKSIGVKGDSSVQSAASGRASTGSRSPKRAVADLVVVGGEDDEALGRDVVGAARRSGGWRNVEYVPSCTCGRWNALASSAERRRTRRTSPPVSPVSSDAQRVVEVVGPGGVAAPAAELGRRASPSGRSGRTRRSRARRARVHAPGDLGHEVLGAASR